MMRWVVLVPGIMGSSLSLDGDEVWPPSVWDVVTGYDDIVKLMDDRVVVDDIIDKVFIKPVYHALLGDIAACGYSVNDVERRFVPFPYDWRKSNEITAVGLAACLDAASAGGLPDDITILAHSMGGLVARRVVEGGDYVGRAWFDRIMRVITFGTPHFGAPQAVARLTGKEKVLGVSGHDIVLLASDPRYSALYELAGPHGPAFTVDVPLRGQLPKVIDRFDKRVAIPLDLNSANIDAANAFWSKLDLERRPAGVEYYFFGGAAHTTVTSCQTDGTTVDTITRESAGDGTVPVSSSIVPEFPHGYSRKEHMRVFEDRDVREALYRFLDAPSNVRPQSADSTEAVGKPGTVGLSVNKETYEVGEPVEIVVSYSQPVDNPTMSFGFARIIPANPEVPEAVASVDITLGGQNVSNFAVTITPELEPGLYELTTSLPTDDPERTMFVVSTPSG